MDFNALMADQPAIIRNLWAQLEPGVTIAVDWLTSPVAWTQFGLLIVAFIAAWYARRALTPTLTRLLTPKEKSQTYLSKARRQALQFLPLLLPAFAILFTSMGEQATRAAFGSGAVIAFGKNVFLFIAARILARDIIRDPFLKLLARYALVPAAFLNIFGLLTPLISYLDAMSISLGNISFSALAIIRGAIAGAILFWLGRWSNDQSSEFIRRQADMRPATRELAAKGAEILIFGTAFLLLMNVMGVSLSALAVLGGAIGVGLGFGLQKIASNFISGIILLLEGQATVGDFVELDAGQSGTIVKMTARATILETFDGKWIVVPNEDFIVTRVTNYSDGGSANRYEVPFSVSYNSDLEMVCNVINKAVATYEHVLLSPEPPDTEIRGFGDNGINLAVEFWCNGLDDGKNRFTADVHLIVWKALREHQIEIPFPQRVVEIKSGSLTAAT